MKVAVTAGLALLLLSGPAVYAQDTHHEGEVIGIPHWDVGDKMSGEYSGDQYAVGDWKGNHLRRPPRGEHWVHVGDRFLLVADKTGLVRAVRMGEEHH